MTGAIRQTGRIGLIALLFGLAALVWASSGAVRADAARTVWLCKPGAPDNPCLDGSLGGTRTSPQGTSSLGYSAARNPSFDCFYVYPTQSEQTTPNADLSRDEELKLVAINQASQFSRVCDVYAPVYRQYTFQGEITDRVRDIAYAGVVGGFREYLRKHNRGRGFVLIGHSQGASHLARLLDEVVDRDAGIRKRMISAIVPGSNNVYVPKGKLVGGNLSRIPACRAGDQIGCVMAWSTFLEREEAGLPDDSSFGRLSTGYWVYPEKRPDPSRFEVLCVNPAELSGDGALATPLFNLPAFFGNTDAQDPWEAYPGFYRSECLTGEDASWLDLAPVPGLDSGLGSLLATIMRPGNDLHTGDLNVFIDNLVPMVSVQAARHGRWRQADRRLTVLERRLSKARRANARAGGSSPALRRKVAQLERQVRKARKAERAAYRPSGGSSSA